MQLNLKKFKYMRFVGKNPIPANYAFDGYELELVDKFLYLEVLFDSRLNFILHISVTVNKGRNSLGFMGKII